MHDIPPEHREEPTANRKAQSYLPDIHRSPPHSSEAEKGILCSIILGANEPLDVVTPEHFHIPAHADVYGVLKSLLAENVQPDFNSIAVRLQDIGKLNEVGGAAFISDLCSFIPTAANAEYYTEILNAKLTLRKIIFTATQYASKAYDGDEPDELLADFEKDVLAIKSGDSAKDVVTVKPTVVECMKRFHDIYNGDKTLMGLRTGFKHLDYLWSGMHPAEMIVIAARPSVGKTGIAVNICEHVAVSECKTVVFFTAEMTKAQLVHRMMMSRARINSERIQFAGISNADLVKYGRAGTDIAPTNLIIEEVIGWTIQQVVARARRIRAKFPDIALIAVDYLQKLSSSGRKAAHSREIEISEISSGIKGLASEFGCPVLALAQIGRDAEKGNRKPRLSDLRESGSIEQDSDKIAFLIPTNEDEQGGLFRVDLDTQKHRNGPIGLRQFTFEKAFTRFAEVEPELHHEQQGMI